MSFIQSLLLDPTNTMRTYPAKKIDALKHKFDKEPLDERLYSIYSALCEDNLNTNTIFKLKSYKNELEFLRLANKPRKATKAIDIKRINKAWIELKSNERSTNLEKILC